MRKSILFFVFAFISISVFLISCKKEETKVFKDTFDSTGFTLLKTENFVSDAHTTTGQVLIYTKADSIVYEFKNFKTDDGPNLDVWLVNDIDNVVSGGYLDLGDLKATEGNFYYRTKSTASYSFLVIWCTDFSVKFGHSFTI